MSSKLRYLVVAAATVMFLATAAAPAAADGVVDPAPIGPGNYFIGEVNGAPGPAIIHMACVGPIIVGQTGHPVAGQKVVALPVTAPVSNQDGYTGTAANSIVVQVGPPSSSTTPIILHDWAVSALIPTTLTLPCGGTGTVTFVPMPTSATAKSATVTVTYVGQP